MVDVIFFNNQEEFSDWLEEHAEASELWVGYFKKSTGRASLTWSISVDAALCFGWIDGIRKTIDEQIKVNQPAWLFFTNLAPSYKRDSIWWVMSAKKEETRLKRLGILIASSEVGLKIPTLRKK